MRTKQCFMKTTHTMKSLITLAVAATIGLAATSVVAGPIYTFSISEGTQPVNCSESPRRPRARAGLRVPRPLRNST